VINKDESSLNGQIGVRGLHGVLTRKQKEMGGLTLYLLRERKTPTIPEDTGPWDSGYTPLWITYNLFDH
jgi:hypothetical protein